jgi:hypothetical protein
MKLHDLRRTLTTNLQKMGVPKPVAEACLNHKSGTVSGVFSVYAVHDYADEKREALQAWADHIKTILEAKRKEMPADVTPMRKRA